MDAVMQTFNPFDNVVDQQIDDLEKQMDAAVIVHAYDEEHNDTEEKQEELPATTHQTKLKYVIQNNTGKTSPRRSSVSNMLAATTRELEKQMAVNNVTHSLSRRSSRKEIVDRNLGLQHENVSNVLAAPAKDLQKQINKDHVSQGLNRRASRQELLERGVLRRPPSESSVLAGTAIVLEKKLNQDRVSTDMRNLRNAQMSVNV